MIDPTRVDRWYTVTDQAAMRTSGLKPSWIIPAKVQATHVRGEQTSVIITGKIRKADGQMSTKVGRVIWGRFGWPLDQAPQWVRDLADRSDW
jgi:hypothetical protein